MASDREMVQETEKRFGLDSLVAIWARRKWLAIPAFVGPMAVAMSLIAFVPNTYRSTATVLVDRQQVPEAFVRSTVTSALETRLHTISQEVLSRARLEELINRFGLYVQLRRQASLEYVVNRMRGDIKLELKSAELRGLREATVAFTITYQGSDPALVSRVTNTLAAFYIEENTRARERQATGTAEFLKAQLGETKTRLDDQEQRVSGFKRRYLGELPQQLDANLGTLDRLQAQLRQNADNQTRAVERRQALSSQLAEAESMTAVTPYMPGLLSGPPVPVTPADRLAQKKEELARLRTQFAEKYPDVVQLKGEVALLEREVANAKSAELKPGQPSLVTPPPISAGPASPYLLRLREALGEAQTDLKVLKAEEARLHDSVAMYQARVENVPRREQEYKELSRDYESTRELYGSLLKRYEEAQIAESMEQRQKGEQFKVLDPAVASPQPAAPNRLKLLLIGVVGALGLATAVVVMAEHLDTSFHELDDLRAFSNVPVLASIPRIVTRTDIRRQMWRVRLGAMAMSIALAVIVALSYVATHGSERLTLLLTRLAS